VPAADTIAEKRLLLQVAEGDETAFKNLFDSYWDHIYTVALALCKSVDLAEDMVQEIFIKVWTHRAELPAIDRFDNYLFIIARNHIYSALKKESTQEKYRQQIKDWFEYRHETPEQQFLFKEARGLVSQAIAQLTPQQQLVYKMTREDGLSHAEVAAALHLSTNTVRNHMVGALRSIREWLRDHSDPLVFILCLLETLR